MHEAGLVSITFRPLPPEQIIELVGRAGLTAIEWGGDVHVPHGDVALARQVGRWTRDAGLKVAAYGSYYRVGHAEPVPFEQVLATAVELGAPRIRVWPGKVGSAEADEPYRGRVVSDARRIAEAAAGAEIGVVFEYHAHTLTDTKESARGLLEAVDHPNVGSYWQPPRHLSKQQCLAGLEAVLPWLAGLHVFQWRPETGERRPLAEGADVWPDYLAKAASAGRLPALLEFVRNDDPQAFLRDAAVLKEWTGSLAEAGG